MTQKERIMKFLAACMWLIVGLMFLTTINNQTLFTGNTIINTLSQEQLNNLYTRLGTQNLELNNDATIYDLIGALEDDTASALMVALFNNGYYTLSTPLAQVIEEEKFITATTLTTNQVEEATKTNELLKELNNVAKEIEEENPNLAAQVQKETNTNNLIEQRMEENRKKGITKENAIIDYEERRKPTEETETTNTEEYKKGEIEQIDIGAGRQTFQWYKPWTWF